MSNKEIARKQSVLNHIKESIGETKYNDIIKALKEGRTTFYTKKNINGKNIQEYTSNELYKLYKEIKEQIKNIQRANKLNESVDTDNLELKKRLLAILDEELTYRLTAKKFLLEEENLDPNKESEVKEEAESTEEKTEETATEDSTEETATEDTESENKEENPEEDEEVELSRIIITVANQEAADDLKSELVNAGIPEDAIEFETESEEDDEENSKDDTESTESTDDGDAAESEGEANESLHVNTFRKLLEDDESTPDTTEGDDATAEGDAESTDDAESTEEDNTPVKVILTKTDYIETLAQVLNDVYGVSQEEFEEMIGGAIVTDDSEEDSEDSDENKDDESADDSKDETTSNGDDAVDNMSDEDLAALFGESANK